MKNIKYSGEQIMPITLMYITNRPEIAHIAQTAGVDRIWIDLEYMGKEQRQAGLNSVKSNHTMEDIARIKPLTISSELMVRVNPLHKGSKKEIDSVIELGAEIVMLPMFKTKKDVEYFIEYVAGRSKVLLLLETAEASLNIENYIDLAGIDEIHIGLNDLHLAYKKKFMFELLIDGTVERLCKIMKEHNIRFGFGGIARIGFGILPAELILTEHYSLGSQMAILSRGFCDANIIKDPNDVKDIFIEGVRNIRLKEDEVRKYTNKEFSENHRKIQKIVKNIVSDVKRRD